MQTIEETLFANRKTKEKKCSKQLSKYPFKATGGWYNLVIVKLKEFNKIQRPSSVYLVINDYALRTHDFAWTPY
jgi:hypothetical protein